MSKKKNKSSPAKEHEEIVNPYDLKSDAVDRLVEADKKTYPKLTLGNDPRKKYQSSFLARIPGWVKSLFMKFWFNGAVCYFIMWGLGLSIPNMTDMIVVLAVVLGIVTDILVNNAFRFLAVTEGENDKWMMFPKKRFVNLFLNIIYSFVVLLMVIFIYNLINAIAAGIRGTTDEIVLGVEPILFGLFYMGVDMLFIAMKNLFIKIIRDAKSKNGIK